MLQTSHDSSEQVYGGGCHCGSVRFRVKIRQWRAIACNCSICTKKGFLHHIVPPSDFELLQGDDDLTTYRFNTGTAQHLFCQHCGIHPFYHPRSHPDQIDVNLNCLDEPNLREKFEVVAFEGRAWEENIASIR
ncbi:GFA family protein [Candidatus Synechococcus calcipolaris G9]|uniref:GFA family protein n=1 Tax=Candidatus Synechococcus calcipolaris G9 TaxID=1497997 RepID=A0ABT6EYJ8_9SYNE|nr:GFA family protein [Candidatus Synechococcus calcipolaris]MDG2990866.1 GFA family protein [Candidatus Synechococcus calcipolaris G9]